MTLAASLATAGPTPRFDPGRVAWRELSFKASKWLITARSDVVFTTEAAAELQEAASRSPAPSRLTPGADQAASVTIVSRLLGRQSTYRAFFDPTGGQAYAAFKHNRGRKPYRKTFWFTADSASMRRAAPADRSERNDPARWSDIEDVRYALEHPTPTRPVVESTALFYLIAASSLEQVGDVVETPIFTGREVALAIMEATAAPMVKARYTRLENGRATRVKAREAALEISVRATALSDGNEPLKLLGLKEDIRVYLCRKRRIPLLLRGRMDTVGSIEVRLERATLAAMDFAPSD